MVDSIPFGKKVADKFIRIYLTPYLRKIGTNPKLSANLPEGYNNLYDLTKSEYVQNPKVVKSLTEGFEKGNFINTKGESVSLNKTSLSAVKKQVITTDKVPNLMTMINRKQMSTGRTEPVLDTVFATIRFLPKSWVRALKMVWKLQRFQIVESIMVVLLSLYEKECRET